MTNDKEPFQVVLIDLQQAAEGDIQCVKKPLTDQLNYVAISYRWGELQETSINTQVGYVASITSFDMEDFYQLCQTITREPTMASMDYVWVDTICVNQSNHDQRKETIYHMTEIYEQATWILAVPDLHAEHLRMMHGPVMEIIQKHQVYLYHLVHGNMNQLEDMDSVFVDAIGLPQDCQLSLLLDKYTHCFANGFMHELENSYRQNDALLLDHLADIHVDKHPNRSPLNMDPIRLVTPSVTKDLHTLHQCSEVHCPFHCYHYQASRYHDQVSRYHDQWPRDILERSIEIRQAMHFLTNLIVDWSSRVWVISEFHISKKKNNLKFWFTQLKGDDVTAFFTFDIHDPKFTKILNTAVDSTYFTMTSNPVYLTFYKQLITQLNEQSFLEMMLKSKATKNEDRFYAIFPFFPSYKPLLKEAVSHVNGLVSVKLKLYQVMTNQDKVTLAYLSALGKKTWTLPTFATSVIDWTLPIDGEISTEITLCHDTLGPYLKVKPAEYQMARNTRCQNPAVARTLNQLLHPKTLEENHGWLVDMVTLVDFVCFHLMGSFEHNIWILGRADNDHIVTKTLDHGFPGFHVY